MVAGENDDVRFVERRRQRVLHAADLQGQFFESAECAERFGLLVDLVAQGRVEFAVGRENGEVHVRLAKKNRILSA